MDGAEDISTVVGAPAMPQDSLESLEQALDYTFMERNLLWMALTHRSFSNEQGREANYERLEFLGDSVLGLVTAEWLYRRFPDEPEGELAKIKSFLVSAPVLANHAESLGLGRRLLLGVGEDRSGGRRKASILADTLEAVFGAVYLDGGLVAAQKVIEPIVESAHRTRAGLSHTDSKTLLQELSQARGWGLPSYVVTAATGPDHRKVFTVECTVDGRVAGCGEGRSKKEAAQQAAAASLVELDLLRREP